MEELITTPVKKTSYLSVEARSICLLCQENIEDVEKKINLWKLDGGKSHHCKEIELFFQKDLSKGKCFQVICRKCYKSFQNGKKLFDEKQKQFSRGLALAEDKYVITKTSRMSKFPDPAKKKTLRKSLEKKSDPLDFQNLIEDNEYYLVCLHIFHPLAPTMLFSFLFCFLI